jgi:hypothetical protein
MRPINQVLRREDRQTGKDVKGRVHGVVGVVDADDGRVGREAGDDGIHDWAKESMSQCIQ